MLRKITETKLTLVELLKLKSDFDELFSLDYPDFIKVMQACIPESLLMKGKAHESAEATAQNNGTKKNVFGLTEVEEIRAFSGLFRFKDVMNGTKADYDKFVACQIEMKKPVLTYEAFLTMREYVTKTLNSAEDYAAAMWSILCNDLGKVVAVIEEYNKFADAKNIGHDTLLAEMIKRKPEMFRGFCQLPVEYQMMIMKGYASGCDISQFEQEELPNVALHGLTGLTGKELDLYFLHTVFDVSGAAAAFKPNGSLTMHQETWMFFEKLRAIVNKLHHGSSIEQVFADYLQFRGDCIGIKNTTEETAALIRIAGMSRFARQGQWLLAAWDKLPVSVKATLVKELNVHGGHNERAIFIGYGVAMLVNPQENLKKLMDEKSAVMAGLGIGLTVMARAFEQARKVVGNDTSTEIFVAECAEVAKSLGKDPRKALETELVISKPSDGRRMDFELPLPQLQAAATTEKGLSPHVALSTFTPAKPVAAPASAPAPAMPKL